jgi:agmatinase
MPHPVVVLGLPYDGSSSFQRGAAEAPPLIREALTSPAGNRWTEALIDLGAPGRLHDAGDVSIPDGPGAREKIETAVDALLDRGARPVFLGGDHSVTYPILRALGPRHPRLTVVQFDAHPDLYDVFEGDRYSHACPFARIMEEGLATRLVQLGIRTMTGHQREQASHFGVEVHEVRRWPDGLTPAIEGPVYVSFDLDGLDPAFAPGVSHQEPGGLSVRQALDVIQRLPGPIVGADVVEYNPRNDVGGVTARVAAKLVKELVARLLE